MPSGASLPERAGERVRSAVSDELAERPSPFRAVGFMLSSLGHAVAKRFAVELAPLGLEPRQFAALRVIGVAEGISQQAVGERLRIPASRIVALVDEFEARGYVERRRRERDRRVHALHLTAAGVRVLKQAMEIAAAFDKQLASELSAAESAQLLALLDRLAHTLGVPPGVHGSQV